MQVTKRPSNDLPPHDPKKPRPFPHAVYNITDIMRARWTAYHDRRPLPTPASALAPYQADLQKILSTTFRLDDLVHYSGRGDPTDPAAYIFSEGQQRRMLDFYRAYGFLNITGVLSADECREAIFEIIREVIARQGLKPEHQITVPVPRHPKGEIKVNALGQQRRMLDFYRAYGFLNITGVLSADECREAIFEIIREVIARQGLKPEHQITVPVPRHPKGEIKVNALTAEGLRELEEYKDDVLRFFTKTKNAATGQPAYTKAERDMLKNGWTLHRDFGACTDPSNMHMRFQWKLRQDPRLLKVWQVLYGTEDVMPGIDRAIEKPPGEGNEEICHLDLNVSDVRNGHFSDRAAGGSKLSLTPTGNRFWFVPNSNTREFCAWFAGTYGQTPSAQAMSGAKFAIHPDKDPCELWGFLQSIELEAGAVAIWHPHCLHAARKNGKDEGILFGDYNCGFVTSECKQTRAMFVDCMAQGTIPPVWKSGDPIVPTGMPKKFLNFPSHIKRRRAKLDAGDAWVWEHMLTEEDPEAPGARKPRIHRFKTAARAPIEGFVVAPVDARLRNPELTAYMRRRLGL